MTEINVAYEWRERFDNAELSALHAEAFDHHRLLEDDGWGYSQPARRPSETATATRHFPADINTGTHTVPDLADAVPRHEVIAAIESCGIRGTREGVALNSERGVMLDSNADGYVDER